VQSYHRKNGLTVNKSRGLGSPERHCPKLERESEWDSPSAATTDSNTRARYTFFASTRPRNRPDTGNRFPISTCADAAPKIPGKIPDLCEWRSARNPRKDPRKD